MIHGIQKFIYSHRYETSLSPIMFRLIIFGLLCSSFSQIVEYLFISRLKTQSCVKRKISFFSLGILHYLLLLFLHETSSVKNQYNDIKDKIEKKKWTVLPEGRVSVLCSWHFQLVRCAFSSFLKRPSVWISLILAGISFQAFKAE